jgi:REP element-mobilizing transposase RayT
VRSPYGRYGWCVKISAKLVVGPCEEGYGWFMAKRRVRKARPRKRHEQIELLNKGGTGKARQQRKARRVKAGEAPKRRGRPIKGDRAGAPHKKRDAFKASEPIHVVLRVEKGLGGLRRRDIYHAVRGATLVVASREDFRLVHISIQGNHIHLLVEADGKKSLSRGMQAFQISAAKRMNAVVKRVDPETHEVKRRSGKVFSDRYHAEVINSRKQARHALAYVLNNWRKHREDRDLSFNVDPFSSGFTFRGWKVFADPSFSWTAPATYEPMVVWEPKTWLLREGWLMYGRIDFREVPSSAGRASKRRTGVTPRKALQFAEG